MKFLVVELVELAGPVELMEQGGLVELAGPVELVEQGGLVGLVELAGPVELVEQGGLVGLAGPVELVDPEELAELERVELAVMEPVELGELAGLEELMVVMEVWPPSQEPVVGDKWLFKQTAFQLRKQTDWHR